MSDKEELISQGAAASRKQAGMGQQGLTVQGEQYQSDPESELPDFQRKIILITEDIKKLRKSSFLMKMKNTLTSSGPALMAKVIWMGVFSPKHRRNRGLIRLFQNYPKIRPRPHPG